MLLFDPVRGDPEVQTLNLRHLKLFLAVAEDLHFSNAAKRMGVAEPAVSRAIRALEQELDVALFNRNSRNVKLTSAGRMLQIEGAGVLDQLTRAVRTTHAAAQGEHGVLRIGYMDFALEGAFPRILKEFRARHAGVAVIARASHTEQILADLQGRHVDVGFLIGPVEDPEIESRTLHDDTFVVVVSDTHRYAEQRDVCLTDLADEPLIMGRRETWAPYLRSVEALCLKAGFAPNIVQEADTTEGIFAFVAAGMGSTIYVERAFSRNPPGTVVKRLRDVSSMIASDLAWRRDHDNPLIRNFIALSEDMIQPSDSE